MLIIYATITVPDCSQFTAIMLNSKIISYKAILQKMEITT